MEFTRHAIVEMSIVDIQRHIRVVNLPDWCASIVAVDSQDSNQGRMTCLSGDFVVHRELLQNGVRFTIPAGPHAIQWTLTTDGDGDILVHCTLNTDEAAEPMQQALNCFVDNWKSGLESWPDRRPVAPAPSCDPVGFSMGGFG